LFIGPAVREFAASNHRFFLEAERRELLTQISGLEVGVANYQERIAEKKRELAAIESKLTPPSSPRE
jgi:hypothetical protein